MNHLNIFFVSLLLCLHDALRLKEVAGTSEAWLWAALTLLSAAVMFMAAKPFMPKN